MEHGDSGKTEVESTAAYIMAKGTHLRLVADFDQATTIIGYTGAATPERPRPAVRPAGLIPYLASLSDPARRDANSPRDYRGD
jgi:hypothetical protein